MDWEGLKKIAYGPLNLKPGEFWTMSPGEFNDLINGYLWRKELDENRLVQQAWLIAQLQRAKRVPKLDKLLRKPKPKEKKLSKQELLDEWKALQSEFRL
ncbi:hypothetical protein JCM15765_14680 [Paradesulfitobacterium aromaticivorans]